MSYNYISCTLACITVIQTACDAHEVRRACLRLLLTWSSATLLGLLSHVSPAASMRSSCDTCCCR